MQKSGTIEGWRVETIRMHPHLAELFAQLDASRAAVEAAVDGVPEAVRGNRPGPSRWSVNEVLEHLALVDRRFDGVVGRAIAEARDRGLGPERGARVAIPQTLVDRVVDRSDRRDAPVTTVPTGSLDHRAACAAMEDARRRFLQTLKAADGLALSEVTVEHQRWGSLTVYQWAELLARHDTRHAAQIQEIAANLRAGPAGSVDQDS